MDIGLNRLMTVEQLMATMEISGIAGETEVVRLEDVILLTACFSITPDTAEEAMAKHIKEKIKSNIFLLIDFTCCLFVDGVSVLTK